MHRSHTSSSSSKSTPPAFSPPPRSTTPDSPTQTREIPLHLIDLADPKNGRLELDLDRITALANTIQATGLLNPITVRPAGERYELVAGRHRHAAVTQLGWPTITATIRSMDDYRANAARLAENCARSNLSPIEEAVQLGQLVENNANGVDGIAADIGRSTTWILDRLEILDWPPSLQQAVHTKRISMAAAKPLVRITPPELREQRIKDAVLNGINARTASLWLADARATASPESEMSEIYEERNPQPIEVTTTLECAVCARPVKLVDTHSMRCCTDCIRALRIASLEPSHLPEPVPNEQSPMHEPPVYDPPDPTTHQ